MENQSFFDYIKLYIKKNISSLIGVLFAIAGYVFFIIIAITSGKLEQGEYMTVMPMLVNLAIYIFSIMYVLDQIRFYLSPKSDTIQFLFHTQDNRIKEEPPVTPFVFPILSVIYRVFTYTGFFVGLITGVVVYLGQYYTGLASSLLIAGVLLSLLYEAYRVIAFLIAKVMTHFIGKKPSSIIISIISFIVFVFILVLFILKFASTGDFMAGLGNIAGNPIWDYIPVSRWAFDILYVGLGRSLSNTFLIVGINFIVSEILLYLYFIYKQRAKSNIKETMTDEN